MTAAASNSTDLVPVPPLNLGGQFASIADELLAELEEVARSGYYVLGPKVTTFEEALAQYCGTAHALGVSSGTDALLCALMALGVGPGDEVIVPTFTFFGTAGTVARLGAKPVFCDITPGDFNIDPADVARKITPRTKALMPVHLYGQLADMPALLKLAAQHNLPIIEDAAQAVGAADDHGKRAGSFGLFGALSFYPTKNLGALGDAGAILTPDAEMLELCRKLRIHGSGHTYYHDIVGGNFRIDALQAALLTRKLAHLEAWTEKRRANAARYTALFQDAGLTPEHIRTPEEIRGRHVYHQYVLRAQRRDALIEFLRSKKIGAAVYYPLPLHLQKCFADLGGKVGDCPQAEQAAAEVVALPIYPELTEAQQASVAAAIKAFYSGKA